MDSETKQNELSFLPGLDDCFIFFICQASGISERGGPTSDAAAPALTVYARAGDELSESKDDRTGALSIGFFFHIRNYSSDVVSSEREKKRQTRK
ncbi:hypothetical protein RUM43_004247 [Polyplax serrata]|uniref:Uncharacterized protein n=1 Tax=Polyplax serrata TaxID=468196 RepID=A0AAN8XLL8_POLSC